jgi:regulatory protein
MWPSRKKAGRPADTSGPDASSSGFSRSSETKTLSSGFSRSSETKTPSTGFSRSSEAKTPSSGFSRSSETKTSSSGFSRSSEAKTPSSGFSRSSEMKASRGGSFGRRGKDAPSAEPFPVSGNTAEPLPTNSSVPTAEDASPSGSSVLSAFSTGESFDPPESAPADTLERKSGRTPVKRSLKGRALGYLSRREHSRAELARKLTPFVEEGESLDTVLDALEREGWLSDVRFAESVVHRRSGRLGTSRIVGELKRNAIDGELVDQLAGDLRDSERARAHAVWSKKFSSLPETAAERMRQARFLMMRGFSSAAVSAVLKGAGEHDEDFDVE